MYETKAHNEVLGDLQRSLGWWRPDDQILLHSLIFRFKCSIWTYVFFIFNLKEDFSAPSYTLPDALCHRNCQSIKQYQNWPKSWKSDYEGRNRGPQKTQELPKFSEQTCLRIKSTPACLWGPFQLYPSWPYTSVIEIKYSEVQVDENPGMVKRNRERKYNVFF